jgi:hypothetical protein
MTYLQAQGGEEVDETASLEIIKKFHECYNKFKYVGTAEDNETRRNYGFGGKNLKQKMTKQGQGVSDRERWYNSILGKALTSEEKEQFVTVNAQINKTPETVFNADIVQYIRLLDAIKTGKNIIYETTGKFTSGNVLDEILKIAKQSCFEGYSTHKGKKKRYNYIVLCAANIISVENNKDRIKKRFVLDLNNYRADKVKYPADEDRNKRCPAPRILEGDLNEENIQRKHNIINTNLKHLINKCVCVPGQTPIQPHGQCKGVGIDFLLLFDQNTLNNKQAAMNRRTLYPSAVIPLSERSQFVYRATTTGPIKFDKRQQKVVELLLGTQPLCPINGPNMVRRSKRIKDDGKAELKKAVSTPTQFLPRKSDNEKALKEAIKTSREKMKKGGRKKSFKTRKNRKRRKTRKARKKKRKSRKRTRASVEKLEGFLKNFSKYDGNICKLKEIYK